MIGKHSSSRRSIIEYVKKERAIFARYNRAHPNFKRNMLIDAVISSVLVLVGFGAINQFALAAPRDMLLRSGAVSMTSDELIKHVRDEKVAAYWLGPLPGYKYTIICTDRREIIVSYIPQGVSLNSPDRFNLTVETYESSLANEKKGMSGLSTDRDDFVAPNGTVVTVDSSKPQMVTLAMPGTGKMAEVHYRDAKSIDAIYLDAEHVRLISEPKP